MEDLNLLAIDDTGNPVTVSMADLKAQILDTPPVVVVPPEVEVGGFEVNGAELEVNRLVRLKNYGLGIPLNPQLQMGYYADRHNGRVALTESFLDMGIILPSLVDEACQIEVAFCTENSNQVLEDSATYAYYRISKVDGINVHKLGTFAGALSQSNVIFNDCPAGELIKIAFYPGTIRISTYYGIFVLDYDPSIHRSNVPFNVVVSVRSLNGDAPSVSALMFEEGKLRPLNELPLINEMPVYGSTEIAEA